MFHSEKDPCIKNEISVYKKLQENLTNQNLFYFPKLVGDSIDSLLIEPRGYHFDQDHQFTIEHAISTLNALKYFHKYFIHRDIRPSNLLYQSGNPK